MLYSYWLSIATWYRHILTITASATFPNGKMGSAIFPFGNMALPLIPPAAPIRTVLIWCCPIADSLPTGVVFQHVELAWNAKVTLGGEMPNLVKIG